MKSGENWLISFIYNVFQIIPYKRTDFCSNHSIVHRHLNELAFQSLIGLHKKTVDSRQSLYGHLLHIEKAEEWKCYTVFITLKEQRRCERKVIMWNQMTSFYVYNGKKDRVRVVHTHTYRYIMYMADGQDCTYMFVVWSLCVKSAAECII